MCSVPYVYSGRVEPLLCPTTNCTYDSLSYELVFFGHVSYIAALLGK